MLHDWDVISARLWVSTWVRVPHSDNRVVTDIYVHIKSQLGIVICVLVLMDDAVRMNNSANFIWHTVQSEQLQIVLELVRQERQLNLTQHASWTC